MHTGDRLNLVYEDFINRTIAKNKQDFCNILGIDYTSFSKYISGSINFSINSQNISNFTNYNINLKWLLTGEGEMYVNTIETKRNEVEIHKDLGMVMRQLADDGILIPLLDQKVSAGFGEELSGSEAAVRMIQVPPRLSRYGRLAALQVHGDSMYPTLRDNDIVICDMCPWAGDGVYVIKDEEFSYVKRIIRTTQGFQVVSDNAVYPPYLEGKQNLCIVGKVRGAIVLWE